MFEILRKDVLIVSLYITAVNNYCKIEKRLMAMIGHRTSDTILSPRIGKAESSAYPISVSAFHRFLKATTLNNELLTHVICLDTIQR